jgi:SAM-dependent methyltransferase
MQVQEYFAGRAHTYDEEFSETSIWSIAHRIGLDILHRHLAVSAKAVLDAGCGTGKWGKLFCSTADIVTFVDISEQMVDRAIVNARSLGASATIDGRVLPVEGLLGIESSTYDLTLCMGDPLSYARDPQKGIAELARVTKPAGLIFVSVDSRLGYLRVFKERDGYELDALADFIRNGDIVGWEGLKIHAFRPDELREKFADVCCTCVDIWGLPTVSGYFLFDPAFQQALKKESFMRRLVELELEAVTWGHPTGTHHLYGLFRKDGN